MMQKQRRPPIIQVTRKKLLNDEGVWGDLHIAVFSKSAPAPQYDRYREHIYSTQWQGQEMERIYVGGEYIAQQIGFFFLLGSGVRDRIIILYCTL